MRRRWGWMLLVLASAMGACGVGVDRLQTCAPGAVQACACGGGLTGRQTCSVDGLGYGACADCGSTSSICAPGQTIACACGNGTMGAQACLADRSGYGPCAPCNSSTPTDVPGVRDAVACSTGRTACSGRCVDTNADPSHCGVCGLACASGERCSMGTCLVQSTPSDVPVVTDRAPACPSGTTTCEGRCVNVASDNTHCGGCGQPCGAGQSCTGERALRRIHAQHRPHARPARRSRAAGGVARRGAAWRSTRRVEGLRRALAARGGRVSPRTAQNRRPASRVRRTRPARLARAACGSATVLVRACRWGDLPRASPSAGSRVRWCMPTAAAHQTRSVAHACVA
jgi:hypothetical protein